MNKMAIYISMLVFDAGILAAAVWLIEDRGWVPGTMILALIIIAGSAPPRHLFDPREEEDE